MHVVFQHERLYFLAFFLTECTVLKTERIGFTSTALQSHNDSLTWQISFHKIWWWRSESKIRMVSRSKRWLENDTCHRLRCNWGCLATSCNVTGPIWNVHDQPESLGRRSSIVKITLQPRILDALHQWYQIRHILVTRSRILGYFLAGCLTMPSGSNFNAGHSPSYSMKRSLQD